MSTLHVENLKGPTSGASANKITIPTGQTLSAPGHVIQVQQAAMTARQTVAGTSMVDVGSNFEVTITPSSTSSKILVQTALTCIVHRIELINSVLRRTVGSTTTNINRMGWYAYPTSGNWVPLTIAHNYLDSPNTTSACTYKLQVGVHLNQTFYLNYNNTQIVSGTIDDSRSTITAMEIAG